MMFPKPCISTVSGNFFGGGDGTGVCGSSGGKEVVMAVPMNDLQVFPALPEKVAGDLKGMGWDSRGNIRKGVSGSLFGGGDGAGGSSGGKEVVVAVPMNDLQEFPALPVRVPQLDGNGDQEVRMPTKRLRGKGGKFQKGVSQSVGDGNGDQEVRMPTKGLRGKGGKFQKGVSQSVGDFKCDVSGCEHSFKHGSSLKRHQIQSHNLVSFSADDLPGRKWVCAEEGCKQTFKSRSKFRKHLLDEHLVGENEAESAINCSKEVFPIKFDSFKVCHYCECQLLRHLEQFHNCQKKSATEIILNILNCDAGAGLMEVEGTVNIGYLGQGIDDVVEDAVVTGSPEGDHDQGVFTVSNNSSIEEKGDCEDTPNDCVTLLEFLERSLSRNSSSRSVSKSSRPSSIRSYSPSSSPVGRRSSVSSRSVSPEMSLSARSVVKSPGSQSLTSSPSSSPESDIKPKKVYQKAGNVREVMCSVCDKSFANLQNVRKHMKVVHKLPNDEIDERMQGQASTAKKCPHCLNYNTRIHRHMKICKKKPKTKVGRKKKTEEEEEVCDLMGAFKAYDARNPRKLAEKTRNKHLRYAEIILSEMDLIEKGFNSEKLVSSDPPFLSDIVELLENKTPSMRSMYASAYQYLISFLKDFHRKNRNVSSFLDHLTTRRSDTTQMFGVFNKEIEQKRLENRGAREANPAILTLQSN